VVEAEVEQEAQVQQTLEQEDQIQYFQLSHQLVVEEVLVVVIIIQPHKHQEVLVEEEMEMVLVNSELEIHLL
jgi:hypothetical protein